MPEQEETKKSRRSNFSVFIFAFLIIGGTLGLVVYLYPGLFLKYQVETTITPSRSGHNNMFDVSSIIWSYGSIVASHYTFGKDMEGVYFLDLPTVVIEHKIWEKNALARLRYVDSLIDLDPEKFNPETYIK